eukprot:758403-Hanusia_phi.AAC.7
MITSSSPPPPPPPPPPATQADIVKICKRDWTNLTEQQRKVGKRWLISSLLNEIEKRLECNRSSCREMAMKQWHAGSRRGCNLLNGDADDGDGAHVVAMLMLLMNMFMSN